jgi:DNA-binding response OmpR family regulator
VPAGGHLLNSPCIGPPLASKSSSMKKKVLIVEDDHDIVTSLRDRLETLGFETVTAYDGVSALEKLEEVHPNLMLLDLHLPRMSGLEVLEQLAERRARGLPCSDVPVLIMSAFIGAETATLALHAGAGGFVGKPFEWNQLFGIMEEMVRGQTASTGGHCV